MGYQEGKEFFATFSDFMKQLTALATASIIVIVSFLDKLSTATHFRIGIKIAMISFALTAGCGLALNFALMERLFERENKELVVPHVMGAVFFGITLLGTIIGLVFFVLFFCFNY